MTEPMTITLTGSDALDGLLTRDINTFARATPWLHGLMYGYATYGVTLFAALLLAGWWSARRTGDAARVAASVWAGLGTVLAVGINQPIVNAVHEARPYTAMPGLLVLADRSSDFSFPSDHATMAGAVAAGLLLVRRRRLLSGIAAVAAVLIAFARVYIAAHYPHDVAAGLALGAVVVFAGWALLRTPLTALVRRLHRTPLRPVVTRAPRSPFPVAVSAGDVTDRSMSAHAAAPANHSADRTYDPPASESPSATKSPDRAG